MKPALQHHNKSVDLSEKWKGLKKGDLSAFEDLYLHFFQELYAYGMAILPSEAAVKDAIQQVFEDLWKYRGSVSDVENPGFYLMRCMRNLLIRQLNESRRYHMVNVSEAETYESLPSEEALIIHADVLRSNKREIHMLIDELPPRQREVVTLIFFKELSYEEVSSILSISVPSVYTLLWRSISSLRKKYNL